MVRIDQGVPDHRVGSGEGSGSDLYEEAPATTDRVVTYRGFRWHVMKGVFAPYPVFGSVQGITAKNREMYAGQRVLDLGCGCGVRGILAKLSGAVSVLLSDVCEVACDNTRLNARVHAVDVSVVCADMFSGIGERFDRIISYLPSRDAPVSHAWERAIHDPKLRLNHQLIDESPDYLVSGGRLYTAFLDQGNIRVLLDLIDNRGYEILSHRVILHQTGDWHFLSLLWP